jgi:hypothetical protein
MGGKANGTRVTSGSSTGSNLFGSDGLNGLGKGIQQASQNYLQQQAQNGDPNAAGVAAGSQAIVNGLAIHKPTVMDMTKQLQIPSVISSPMNNPNPAPPSLFVPSGNPITSPMMNPGSTGFQMNPPITSPMFKPPVTTPMPMFKPPVTSPLQSFSPANRAPTLFGN